MRQKRTVQHSLFDAIVEHEIAIELEAMSNLLDAHPKVLDWVESDLRDRMLASTGRKGLSVESILRCAILKQSRQLTYQELAFFLQDSISLRAFAGRHCSDHGRYLGEAQSAVAGHSLRSQG